MEASKSPKLLISTVKLANLLKNNPENLKIVCATWGMGKDGKSPMEKFDEAHIPGSVYFGITDIADRESELMATMPSQDFFISEMRRLGIKKTHTIVVYEHDKIYAGLRATYMLRLFGAEDVRYLNGCLTKWIDEDGKTDTGEPQDVNDTSSDGYDYSMNGDMYDDYDSTFKKVHAVESKYNLSIICYLFISL
jgi:thiosulfate/3-mercaptopyruvate sulfurtransferase